MCLQVNVSQMSELDAACNSVHSVLLYNSSYTRDEKYFPVGVIVQSLKMLSDEDRIS